MLYRLSKPEFMAAVSILIYGVTLAAYVLHTPLFGALCLVGFTAMLAVDPKFHPASFRG